MSFGQSKKWALSIGMIFALTGCGSIKPASRTDTVEIPQTPVKNQGRIGFCWAYGMTGFLEAIMLKKNGISINLSEEAIGFYRMAEELFSLSQKYSAEELGDAEKVENLVFESLEGWDITFNAKYNPGFRARNAMELVRSFGVLPEEVFSYKFATDRQSDDFHAFVYSGFAELMKKHGKKNVTQDMIYGLLGDAGAFGGIPSREFELWLPNGTKRKFAAADFASDFIGFSPDDYTYLMPDGKIGYSQIVKAIKMTLARNIDVPLSFTVYKGQPNRWDGSFSLRDTDPSKIENAGGHVVLITDFVNQGGKPGNVSPSAFKTELEKSSEELDFLVIKNSWNTEIQSPLLRLPGYHTLDKSYMKQLVKGDVDITIVVPRDIAFQIRYEDSDNRP
ncbi:MAG: hypothetical protein HQK54_16040 [Oligoflexales bacterium]|nr:hypothetical protein [Oligoflexales bacterium]